MTVPDGVSAGAGGKSVPADYQVTLAEERTTLARQRNILAVERTFSAWLRTGLSLNAVALVMPRLVDIGRWMWVVRIIGITLTISAAFVYYFAYRRYHIASRKLETQGIETISRRAVDVIIAALIFCTLLSLLLLFQET
jgi:putative membrane protein